MTCKETQAVAWRRRAGPGNLPERSPASPASGHPRLLGKDPILDERGGVARVPRASRGNAGRETFEAALNRQLRFERLLSGISTHLIQAPTDGVNPEIRMALRKMREFVDLDCASLFEVAADQSACSLVESCLAPGCESPWPEPVDWGRIFPWIFEHVVRRGQCLLAPSLDDLPAKAELDRANGLARGIESFLAIPLSVSASVGYAIVGVTVRRRHLRLEEYVPQLRLLGDILINALARQSALRQARESEEFSRTVLASLQDGIAVLDREGMILAVNAAWEQSACPDGAATLAGTATGANYPQVCRGAGERGDLDATQVATGVESVLAGARSRFVCEYRSDAAGEPRWYHLVVQPVSRPSGGAIVSHTEITSQRQAEAETQKLRDQLAHMARVAVLGELVAALAHELSQPLTAILSNAQAAQRQLAAGRFDLSEGQAILADIVADDLRAGEIVRRVRASLARKPSRLQPLALNGLVQDVARMVRQDALLRQVRLELDLAPDLPMVRGDPIQLQQVLLNLIANAMDALELAPAGKRRVRLLTQQPQTESVRVSVWNSGASIPEERLGDIFEPFYTTKSHGLGMGLVISRSILRAHNGCIQAGNNPEGGVTFSFTLPSLDRDPGSAAPFGPDSSP